MRSKAESEAIIQRAMDRGLYRDTKGRSAREIAASNNQAQLSRKAGTANRAMQTGEAVGGKAARGHARTAEHPRTHATGPRYHKKGNPRVYQTDTGKASELRKAIQRTGKRGSDQIVIAVHGKLSKDRKSWTATRISVNAARQLLAEYTDDEGRWLDDESPNEFANELLGIEEGVGMPLFDDVDDFQVSGAMDS